MSMSHCSSNKADLCNVRNVRTGRHARVPTLRSVWPGEQGCHLTWSPQKLGHKLAHECTNRMELLKKSTHMCRLLDKPSSGQTGCSVSPQHRSPGRRLHKSIGPSSIIRLFAAGMDPNLPPPGRQHHWVLLGIREGVLFDLKKSQVGSTTAPIKLLFQ